MEIPDHIICLLRNLYAGQEATVRTRCGTMDWFQIGKGVHQGCILSPCLFNFYSEHIIRNVRLDDSQAGIKIARIHVDVWQKTTKFCKANILQLKNKFKRKISRRNINNLRYAEDNTLMIESNEELKSLLMKVKEESEKDGLKYNIQNTKIVASNPIISWQIDGGRWKCI